jgi:hypothetical protein
VPAEIPLWLIASKGGVRNVTITPQSVNASTGALTDGTPVVVTARLRGLGLDMTPEKAEINSVTSPRQNSVVISDGFTFRLEVLKVNNQTNVIDPLRAAILAADVFKLSWVEGPGATTTSQTVTCYGSRGPYSMSVQGRGEVMAELSFDSVDPGSADFFTVGNGPA